MILFIIQLGVQGEIDHPDHTIHRGADLVAHVCQEFAFGLVGGFGFTAGGNQFGDIQIQLQDADHFAFHQHGHAQHFHVGHGAVFARTLADIFDSIAVEDRARVGQGFGSAVGIIAKEQIRAMFD